MITIEQWIQEDKILNDLLVEIQSISKTPLQQAEIAFDKLCDIYNLPKMPEDVERFESYYEKNGIDNPRSVYEELALIKFLEPNDDPRGIVLAAVFHVKNNIGIDINEVFEKQVDKPKKKLRLGIKGEGIHSEIIFINESESWIDLGCKIMLQKK